MAGFDGYTVDNLNYLDASMEYGFVRDKAQSLNSYATEFLKEYIDLNGNVVAPTEQITNLLGVRYTSLVPGYIGNSIFFPAGGTGVYDEDYGASVVRNIYATGSLWARDLNTSNIKNARFFYYYTPNTSTVSQYARMYGRHVRGVVYK